MTNRDRILTTHVGSLPRTQAVVDMLLAKENQTGFDRLAGADIVGNQQVDPRNAQGLPQWKKLIGVLVDAGPERGLEQVLIGGSRSIPAKRAQIRREYARVVGSELRNAHALVHPFL